VEELPSIKRVAANILNKQSRKPKRGGPSAWGLGEVLKNPRCKNWSCYETDTRASDLG